MIHLYKVLSPIFPKLQKLFVPQIFQMEIFHKIVMAELMKHAMVLHALVVTNEMKAL